MPVQDPNDLKIDQNDDAEFSTGSEKRADQAVSTDLTHAGACAQYPLRRLALPPLLCADRVPFDCKRPASHFDWTWYWLNTSPFVLDGADASYACGIRGGSMTDREPAAWGRFVRAAATSVPETWPLVSIWQGADDRTVDPDNLGELVEQWTDVHGIDAVADARETVGPSTREVYHDASGKARVEAWTIQGFPHAIPIDHDGNPDACGTPAAYIENANLCTVRRIATFWGLE